MRNYSIWRRFGINETEREGRDKKEERKIPLLFSGLFSTPAAGYFSIRVIDRWMKSVRFLPLSMPLVNSARSMI